MNQRLPLLLAGLSMPGSAFASVDETIDALVAPLAGLIENVILLPLPLGGAQVPFVVVWLVAAATGFTFYFRFINLRGLAQGFRLVRGDFNDPKAAGEVTHFQALATALSGTVGLGNIAGVAIAVSVGGPGAVPWMMLAGFLGMSSKFIECTLGVKYRLEHPDGTVSGGPMWYLSRGLADRGPALSRLGRICAGIFALFCIGGSFGGANMFQANQSFQQVVQVTGGAESWWLGKGWLFGLILAFFVALVIIGGIRSIARVTSKIVPIMAIVYVSAAVLIIAVHFDQVPAAFTLMFSSALGIDSVAGGALGVLAIGFQRAAFSSEAGIGSAAIAHSAVQTDEPVTEGLVALYEPFIDTIVVCTLTALVIILTGAYSGAAGMSGVELTSEAFSTVIEWFPLVLALAVILFAYSTMLAWAYYGMKCWTYLLGRSAAKENIYKSLFLVFVVIGASMQLGAVIGFSDAMILAMAFPNLLGMYFLMPAVKRDLNHYMAGISARQTGATAEKSAKP
ncbi:MAG: alanine/glycine:cation symporter family protein [Wenzhouxiangellaceae bacterium]|nr:alanine/glycine:cation symporter family protein [Wenzhouxiangellaceae bacterium]